MLFNNLSFTINTGDKTPYTPSPLVSKELAYQIMEYVAVNGHNYNEITSFAQDIVNKYFIPFQTASNLIFQLMELRNVMSNWMNCNSTIGIDASGNDILNSTPPQSVQELKDDAFWTCSRDIDNMTPIYDVSSFDELRDEFDKTVDKIVLWSKNNGGTGTWEYYVTNITKGYNYEEIESQIKL